MKDFQFESLGEIAQTSTIWERGVFLSERLEGFHKIRLYQLEDFYVEVTYHTHFNVILKVGSFTGTEHLDPYLEQISLDSLLS